MGNVFAKCCGSDDNDFRRVPYPGYGPNPGEENFKEYGYNYETTVAPWPMLDTTKDGLPIEQRPSREWFEKSAQLSLKLLANNLASRFGESERGQRLLKVSANLHSLGLGKLVIGPALVQSIADKLEQQNLVNPANEKEAEDVKKKVVDKLEEKGFTDPLAILKSLFTSAIPDALSGRPSSVEDYDKLYKLFDKPAFHEHYKEDSFFSDMRVAGYHPVVIQGIDRVPERFPVKDEMLARATTAGDTLERAGDEGRLYLTDYSILSSIVMGNYPSGPKYGYVPLALFALPPGEGTRRLVPVAIQCGQDPSEFPVLSVTDDDLWDRAKTVVQQADASYHELVSHLGGCHLLMEPFAIATHNQLGYNHPIGRLLTPHFEGTMNINMGAVNTLLGPTGQVSQVLPSTIESSATIAVKSLTEWYLFNDRMLPNFLKIRNLMNKDLNYPYRDDALSLWGTINNWVKNYVSLFYDCDRKVEDDVKLQKWAQELIAQDGGRMKGFGEKDSSGATVPGKLTTVQYLEDAITMIIFTASASHAAVNFGQLQMTYAPAVPGALYRSMPTSKAQAERMPALDHLPPMEVAQVQVEFLTLLGSIHYTQLGQYHEDWPLNDEVREKMKQFQAALLEVEDTIDQRNKTRTPQYELLRPNNVPQSINV